jgi:hypothetical protein
MADTTGIIKALKYWNAERFKDLQRKLTTAKNAIDYAREHGIKAKSMYSARKALGFIEGEKLFIRVDFTKLFTQSNCLKHLMWVILRQQRWKSLGVFHIEFNQLKAHPEGAYSKPS